VSAVETRWASVCVEDELSYACDFLLGLRQTFDRIAEHCPGDPHYLDTHMLHLRKYTDKCEELLHNVINQRRLRQS
jgi:hypothetical protein